MGIFDVVKDVAKVGAEILPIVLDNMPTGTQSQKTVPLGPIKVSVDSDQIYATNLGDQPKDVILVLRISQVVQCATQMKFITLNMEPV